jgi:hypothetical protein
MLLCTLSDAGITILIVLLILLYRDMLQHIREIRIDYLK